MATIHIARAQSLFDAARQRTYPRWVLVVAVAGVFAVAFVESVGSPQMPRPMIAESTTAAASGP